MNIDELLSDLSVQGWLINNCYQTDNRLFRVSLRRPTPSGDWFTEWAEAETMIDALADCMSKLLDAEFVLNQPIGHCMESTKSLIDMLGIKPKPLPPIVRRL